MFKYYNMAHISLTLCEAPRPDHTYGPLTFHKHFVLRGHGKKALFALHLCGPGPLNLQASGNCPNCPYVNPALLMRSEHCSQFYDQSDTDEINCLE